jgi:thiamine-phosphate pyrophosphorylase
VSTGTPRISGLYAITPDTGDSGWLSDAVEAALTGGARLLQYRSKQVERRLRIAQAQALKALCTRYGATFIVNDDVRLAHEVDADGVHVGAHDPSIAAAREALGPGKLVGASCYNELARARTALDRGADYVAFGSFFASRVKPDAVHAPIALISEARREMSLPIVAIGGITLDNAGLLVSAGAHALAVISAVFDAPDIVAAARAFVRLFD